MTMDVTLLAVVRDSTFITRPQLDAILSDTEVRSSRDRRIKKLHDIGQLAILPQCFPYPGRVFYITNDGLMTLQSAGMPMISVSSETESTAMMSQVPHYLGINEIHLAYRHYFRLKKWIGDRRLKSLNIAAADRTQKDYDAIVETVSIANGTSINRFGVEYERTLKSEERYVEIREVISKEKQIHGLIYFVDTDEIATRIAQLVHSEHLPVAVLVLRSFQQRGINANARVVDFESYRVVKTTLQSYLSRF